MTDYVTRGPLKGSLVFISRMDILAFLESLVSWWGLVLFAILAILVLRGRRIYGFLLKKYAQSVELQIIASIIGPLDKFLSHEAEQYIDEEGAADQSIDPDSDVSPPSSVVDFWSFSDDDRVLVVLPRKARRIEADGGFPLIDARREPIAERDLVDGNRYTLLTELLPGELNAGKDPDDSQITLSWSGHFRDQGGDEHRITVKGKNQVDIIDNSEIMNNESEGEDGDSGGYYRFDNIRYCETERGSQFIGDSHTNIEKVEEGELEPTEMRDFPEHLRSAFQVIISLLREHPADLHLDYCLDSEFSAREDRQENIVVIDIDGCNDIIPRIDSLTCSIGRNEGLQGQIRSPDGEIFSNSSNTENGRTIVTSYGMFAHINNPLNSYRSCYVLSGTHPYATIGVAQCIAPIHETHHDGARECCELVKRQFGEEGYFHAITQVKAVNGDIRQPEVYENDLFREVP